MAAWAPSRLAGALYWTALVGGTYALGTTTARRSGERAVAISLALAVGGGALYRSARIVCDALGIGRVEEARVLMKALVSRDADSLDEAAMVRGCVESVAENTVDAIAAPAVFALLAGAPGVSAYRAANTLDAMVGYRTPLYRDFGWFAARMDDIANYLPARLTVLATALCRPRLARSILAAARYQGRFHPSPNGGPVEAAFASALGIMLGGPALYGGVIEDRPQLGWGRPPRPGDIERAIVLSRQVTALSVVLACGTYLAGALAWHRLGLRLFLSR